MSTKDEDCMYEDCAYCGGAPEANLHQKHLVGKNGHDYAPPTLSNRLKALARTFKAETRDVLTEASVKTRRWDALKDWLRDAKTNGKMAEDYVSTVRDLVYLIEQEDKHEEEGPKLEGRALLDRARKQRRAVLAEERYTTVERVVESGGPDTKKVQVGIEVEGEKLACVTVLSGPAADVEEWLDGRVTLEELNNRWRRQRK